jgi:hypothetical protein
MEVYPKWYIMETPMKKRMIWGVRKPLHEHAAIKNMGIETLEISHDIS